MARETSYFVQAFNAGRGGNLKADAPIACKTETGALRTAERLALSKLGVVAFSSTGDSISQRTKAALAAAKARGVKLGNPNLDAIRGSGGAAGKAEAERFAGNVLPIIKQVRKAGATTLQQIADALNDRGVATARGGSWYPSNVRNVLARG
jgi:hypothetical protein